MDEKARREILKRRATFMAAALAAAGLVTSAGQGCGSEDGTGGSGTGGSGTSGAGSGGITSGGGAQPCLSPPQSGGGSGGTAGSAGSDASTDDAASD